MRNLIEEKSKVEEKYTSLVADVNHWMDPTEKPALEQNLEKLKKNVSTILKVSYTRWKKREFAAGGEDDMVG